MLGIGEELKKARESKGFTIYDVERDTKIKATFIEAIEREDFEKIPGRVYVKGFVKNYAKFLGLEYTGYLKEINKMFDVDHNEDILKNSKPELVREIEDKPFSTKVLKAVIFTLVFVALAWGAQKLYLHFTADTPPASNVSQGTSEPAPSPTPAPAPSVAEPSVPSTSEPAPAPTPAPETPQTTAPQTQGVVLDVIMSQGGPGVDACWIQVIVDGKLAFEQTIYSGREPLRFQAERVIDITYGNAAAITLKVNGKQQEALGGVGIVGTKRFRVEDLQS